jgi:ribose/xylose/arabinose/galactoside ABC-type transport system permease subunit
MTIALKEIRQGQALAQAARRINFALVVFLLFYLVIGLLQPNYLEPAGVMNFLRRAAPLAILAAGQIFVLVSGGFDLSVGSLVTLTVVGGSMLTANDPSNTWWAIAVLYAIGLLVGLINGAVVAYLRTPSIIATLGTLLSVNGVGMMWSGGSPRGYLPSMQISMRSNPNAFMRSTRSRVVLENGETQMNVLAPYRIALFLPSIRVRRHGPMSDVIKSVRRFSRRKTPLVGPRVGFSWARGFFRGTQRPR